MLIPHLVREGEYVGHDLLGVPVLWVGHEEEGGSTAPEAAEEGGEPLIALDVAGNVLACAGL